MLFKKPMKRTEFYENRKLVSLGEFYESDNLYRCSARGNPDGPGGYGAVLQYVDPKGILHERELQLDMSVLRIIGWN